MLVLAFVVVFFGIFALMIYAQGQLWSASCFAVLNDPSLSSPTGIFRVVFIILGLEKGPTTPEFRKARRNGFVSFLLIFPFMFGVTFAMIFAIEDCLGPGTSRVTTSEGTRVTVCAYDADGNLTRTVTYE